MSAAMSVPPTLFAKAGKNSKEKKSVLHPKTDKISNPMAKVFKESADDTDSKSGKAKVDVSCLLLDRYLFTMLPFHFQQ
jgi:hypothetical protein